MRHTSICALILLVVCASVAPALAQGSSSATLSGRVVDPQGAVVDGATVEATQAATGLKRTTTTNHEGAFAIAALPVGSYEVVVRASGFGEKRYEKVDLLVGQTVTLDAELAVAGTNESVDADASAEPLVRTVTSGVEGVIHDREIEQLPLNGRNFLELAFLIPGNAPAPNFDPTKTETVSISSAGQLGRSSAFTVDGADNSDDVVGGSLQNISQDAVKEFQIATSRFSAEIGRSGSSVVNIVTKSGTNELHGSASFFYRDDALQGLPATFDRTSGQEPPFDREHYSATIGGPIAKDRAWFFGSFEYRNQDGATLVGTRDLATRSILRSFVAAPLDDLLATVRADVKASDAHEFAFRYSYEDSDATGASSLSRAIGSSTYRQESENRYHTALVNWRYLISERWINNASFSFNGFRNDAVPTSQLPQQTFPSILDGASFAVPQGTTQHRFQFSDTATGVLGNHTVRFGGDVQHIYGLFDLDVFRSGRVEYVEDFPDFDRNGDGQVNDDDLLFSVTLRSGHPDQGIHIDDSNNWHVAGFVQDDWRVSTNLTLNLGLRYELDTDVKNVSRRDEINPIVAPFLSGDRGADRNNFGPRVGFNWASDSGRTSVHGGYGIYYNRVTLEIESLERGLDGRTLPIEVRAGNVFFLDETGHFPPFAPTTSNPFTGFILPGAGASGINVIDDDLQNPEVQETNLGVQQQVGTDFVLSADYLHDLGTHFILGRTIGAVFNPVVGGPDRVVNLESSVNTKYDGLLMSFEKRYSHRYQFRASYTLSKAFNYANDDQIPFSVGPIDPNNLQLEYGPSPTDQRHRFVFSGLVDAPYGIRVSAIWTAATGVPMDILLPDGQSRVPTIQRNAGGRLFHDASDLNAYISSVNATGGVNGALLPLVDESAKFNDSFNSVDLRLSKEFKLGERARIEPLVEVFNLFNVTNILGVSTTNYSGYANALVRDSNDPTSPGFLHSSSFGKPVTTAGGVFGSGGPRAFQLGARFTF